MITICPQCQLPLAVTAADLRIAQGQVRCGRCAAVFNALASLYEPSGLGAERRAPGEVIRAAGAPVPGSTATVPPVAPSTGAPAAASATPPAPAAAPAPAPPTSPPPFWSPVASSPFAQRRVADPKRDATAAPAETQAPDAAAALSPTAVPRPGAPPDATVALRLASPTADDAEAATATPSAPPEPREPQSGGTTILGPNSGLFRAPARDDEPRFDDTHGADDWPADLPAQLEAEAEAGAHTEVGAGEIDPPSTPVTTAAPVESTDAFRRDALLPADVADAAGSVVTVRSAPAAPLEPEAETDAPTDATVDAPQSVEPGESAPIAGRDWDIDTMTAAELASLVARDQGDEPPELASIRIAVDQSSEITVLPGDAPLRAAPPGGSLPRLIEPLADDPDLPGARVEAEERRAGVPASALRWLELEPAPPAAGPEPQPGAFAAALGLDAALDEPGVAAPPPVAGHQAPPMAAATTDFTPDFTPDFATDDADLADGLASATRRPATPRWMWGATVALGLLLATQLVHLYREDLVEVPLLESPLTGLYAALGKPVQPRWDVGRYEVRRQGVVAEPVTAGTLTVRASIRNGAARAQPAPLLRVIFEDRYGNRIATRDLTPREYGGTAALAPAPMLAPGQRIDAEVSLLDPGGDAVGFELDVCLRRADASIRCANDAAPVNG